MSKRPQDTDASFNQLVNPEVERRIAAVQLTALVLALAFVIQVGYRLNNGWDFVWDNYHNTGLYLAKVDDIEGRVFLSKIGIPSEKDLPTEIPEDSIIVEILNLTEQ